MTRVIDHIGLLGQPNNQPLLNGILRGIERETLRSSPEGRISQSAHPEALGATLTHPLITTDFSEALLEFITPPSHDMNAMLNQLEDLHRFTYQSIGPERLWPTSMPCDVGQDSDIPIAQYGHSNRALMKTAYRVGLGHRYGRTMQTVAGVHFNFSIPRGMWALLHQEEGSVEELSDFINRRYFDLIRNFRRNYWLIIYLFGASPAVSRSFVLDRPHNLHTFEQDEGTLYLPHATSLRMGNLGYQSSAQEHLFVCYNTLSNYLNTLTEAIRTPYEAYEKIGLLDASGQHKQLNTSLLQIENEFYSAIRPKRVAQAGETALTALCQRGVEYIEVRCMDINPFDPVGISADQIRFLDTFLLWCLFSDSPPCTEQEFDTILENQKRVVNTGRAPNLALLSSIDDQVHSFSLSEQATNILTDMQGIAELLDKTQRTAGLHIDALAEQHEKVVSPELTPSAQMLNEMREQRVGFITWAKNKSEQHRAKLTQRPLPEARQRRLEDMAEESLRLQQEEEDQAQSAFDAYIQAYYAQYAECCS